MTLFSSPLEASGPAGFELLKTYVLEHTGLAYYKNKDKELKFKFSKRMEQLGLATYQDYLNYLIAPPGAPEWEILIHDLTIGETYFFRYHEQLNALKEQVFPELIQAAHARLGLSIWSAGCATGEEVYTLAILLQESFPQLQNWQVEITGTDINPSFLAQARRASYRKWSFRNNSEQFQQRYFLQQDQEWQLLPAYRKWARFQNHNLIKDSLASWAPAGGFDLIICRNVLIYFDEQTHRRLIESFYRHLQPGGWLVLGPAELTPLSCEPFKAHALSTLSCFQKPLSAERKKAIPTWQAIPWQMPPVVAPIVSSGALPSPLPPSLPISSLPPLPMAFSEPLPPPVPSLPAIQAPVAAEPSEDPLLLIQTLANQGQLSQAETLCRKILTQDPMQARFHYSLSLILNAQGKPQEALLALKQVLYLDRKHILAHYHLGLLLLQTRQLTPALKSFRNALDLLQNWADDSLLPENDEWTVAQLKAQIHLHKKGMA